MQAAVQKAEAALREKMQEKQKYQEAISQRELASYKETISRHEKELAALRQQLSQAFVQIKDMAVGALVRSDQSKIK